MDCKHIPITSQFRKLELLQTSPRSIRPGGQGYGKSKLSPEEFKCLVTSDDLQTRQGYLPNPRYQANEHIAADVTDGAEETEVVVDVFVTQVRDLEIPLHVCAAGVTPLHVPVVTSERPGIAETHVGTGAGCKQIEKC